MKQKKLDILNNILLIFLLIQPLFDIYMSVVGERLDIFGISIVTLIRTTLIVTFFAIVIVYQIKNKVHIKMLYLIFGYLLVVLIYLLIHHLNIVYSNGYYITEGIYNIFTEILYVERLIVPVLLIYTTIITKPSKINIQKVLVTVAAVVSLIIVITNLFCVSYASYAPTQSNVVISYNVIDWFRYETVPYKESLSKGLFVSANQIGALLVVLLPIVINYMLKESKVYLYLIFFIQVVAMTLIGTRVGSLGWMLICLAMALGYVVLMFMGKVRKLKILEICMIILTIETGCLLYIKSPAQNRDFAETFENIYEEEIDEKEQTGEYVDLTDFFKILDSEERMMKYLDIKFPTSNLKYDSMCKYIAENHRYHGITKKYVNKIYPYKDDPEFWINMFSLPASIKGDNRERQVQIIKRIKQNNNNVLLDTLFGMGATPMNSREYMIENDVISHYYNLGILGIIIFVIPFVSCFVYVMLKSRNNILRLFNIQFISYALALCMAYFVGYFAGHVLDEYVVTIYLSIIAATIYNLYKEGELNEKSKT